MTEQQNIIKYYGIADAHGVESFLPYENKKDDSFPYMMRAELNRQRHAVYYEVTVEPIDVTIINAHIAKGDYKKALQFIKKRAITIGFPEHRNKAYMNSWKLIPNSKLDPWR